MDLKKVTRDIFINLVFATEEEHHDLLRLEEFEPNVDQFSIYLLGRKYINYSQYIEVANEFYYGCGYIVDTMMNFGFTYRQILIFVSEYHAINTKEMLKKMKRVFSKFDVKIKEIDKTHPKYSYYSHMFDGMYSYTLRNEYEMKYDDIICQLEKNKETIENLEEKIEYLEDTLENYPDDRIYELEEQIIDLENELECYQ